MFTSAPCWGLNFCLKSLSGLNTLQFRRIFKTSRPDIHNRNFWRAFLRRGRWLNRINTTGQARPNFRINIFLNQIKPHFYEPFQQGMTLTGWSLGLKIILKMPGLELGTSRLSMLARALTISDTSPLTRMRTCTLYGNQPSGSPRLHELSDKSHKNCGKWSVEVDFIQKNLKKVNILKADY